MWVIYIDWECFVGDMSYRELIRGQSVEIYLVCFFILNNDVFISQESSVERDDVKDPFTEVNLQYNLFNIFKFWSSNFSCFNCGIWQFDKDSLSFNYIVGWILCGQMFSITCKMYWINDRWFKVDVCFSDFEFTLFNLYWCGNKSVWNIQTRSSADFIKYLRFTS